MYHKRNKILSLYLSDFKSRHYLREISKLSKISLRTTQRLLSQLEKEKVIISIKEGKNKYYTLNLQNIKTKFYLIISEIEKTIDFLNEYPIFLSFLKEKSDSCLIIFGSFAEFKATKTSDLDVLVITNKKTIIPEHILPYEVHKIELTKKEFQKALGKKETIIKEIIKKHIILTKHDYFINLLWDYYEKA